MKYSFKIEYFDRLINDIENTHCIGFLFYNEKTNENEMYLDLTSSLETH